MSIIDLNRIREGLPKRAKVKLGKTEKGTPFIECKVFSPSLYDKGAKEEQDNLDMVLQWQTDIIGKENIMEFYTESTGAHWYIYLKKNIYEFVNLLNEDINSFTRLNIVN